MRDFDFFTMRFSFFSENVCFFLFFSANSSHFLINSTRKLLFIMHRTAEFLRKCISFEFHSIFGSKLTLSLGFFSNFITNSSFFDISKIFSFFIVFSRIFSLLFSLESSKILWNLDSFGLIIWKGNFYFKSNFLMPEVNFKAKFK